MSNETTSQFLKLWHQFIEAPSFEILDLVLEDDVVFHSPIVWSPQKGKTITSMYLWAASQVLLNEFKYVKQIVDQRQLVLEFQCKIDDIVIEGVDIISLNDEARVVDFKVMVRPYKAIEKVKEKMMQQIMQSQE